MSRAADGAPEIDTESRLDELGQELAKLKRECQDTRQRVGDLARGDAILK